MSRTKRLSVLLRAVRFGALAVAVLILAACVAPAAVPQEAAEAPAAAAGVVELIYQDWATTWFPPMVEEMMPIFNA